MTAIEPTDPALPSRVPESRVRVANREPANADGEFVLYWMIANRRTSHNFSLDRAIEWATFLGKPLVVFEALRAGYQWASDRIHAFVIQGMLDNRRAFAKSPISYWPYLEPKHGDGSGAIRELARRSAVVVSDDFPCFFLPRMTESAMRQIPVRFELIDSNGLYPMRDTSRVFSRAVDFRRHLQKNLLPHLADQPVPEPLKRLRLKPLESMVPKFVRLWPAADLDAFEKSLDGLSEFKIDHSVRPVSYSGGSVAAEGQLNLFLKNGLNLYHADRNQPELQIASGLSPWLHFGHISAHQVFGAVTKSCGWTPDDTAEKATASKSGWWGATEPVEAFLDELVTWRELGFNMCALTDNYDQYESLPQWARKTLADHADDPRPFHYSMEELEYSQTHDELWNAAQVQLVREGRIHNYLRMLWGKKIFEWSPSPQSALQSLIHLNNKYATDGRNPNSYSGIFWVLGRYDRAWGPERPIYGKIRYMTSENTARKVRVKQYISKYRSGESSQAE